MIEVRAAERAHEEIVGEGVFLGPSPQSQLAAVEMAHRPAADGRHRGEHVVAPAVDLLLVVVKGVDRARRELVEPDVYRRRIDPERLVRQARKARVRLAAGAENREVGQGRAVMVELNPLLGGRVGNPVRSGEEAVEMVEAPVLGIDHDDCLDPVELILGPGRSGERDGAGAGEQQQKRGDAENARHGGGLSRFGLPRSYSAFPMIR